MSDFESDEYREGHDAFYDGKTLRDNPYNKKDRPKEHRAWVDGYLDADEYESGDKG